MAKIGVEDSLTDVQQALAERGHEIVQLRQENDAKDCDCCVITGLDSNVMGMADTVTKGPVIEANGLTAEEICQQIDSRIGQ
ncbi:YkuS family protein [Bacillus sp. PS06]|uniref:YkuS family protein n=1 Tax=Bacillus sp. PS06 TaxID=2764176 RepID=UPI00177FFAC8|nr:YkuS family protein [Bacillus sp. PS06]MBD8068473.1 YkuS family protein [Bacillus sp. PS06]